MHDHNMYTKAITGKCRLQLVLIIFSTLVTKCYTQNCTFYETGNTNCTLYVKCQNNIIENMYSFFSSNWRCFRNYRENSHYYYQRTTYNFKIYISIGEAYTAPDWSTLSDMSSYVKSIEVKNGNIEQIATTRLPNIENLTVIHNNINYFSINEMLTHYPLLQKIDLSYNSISDLNEYSDEGQICNLKHIDVSNNLITKIPKMFFLKCSDLLYLDLSHNSITAINILTFEGIYKLITLKLSNNKIFDIGLHLQRFLNLQYLNLDNNELTALTNQSFSNLQKLQVLNVSNNVIKHLNSVVFYDMEELTVLDLSFNYIEKIPSTLFISNKNLETLDLKHNNIEIIEKGAFNNNNAVTSLSLEGNVLQGCIDKNVFAGVTLLHKLDLNSQKISGIDNEFIEGNSLNHLNFSSNSITNISATAFKLVTNLITLDISNNLITVLEFDVDLPNLSMLYLKNNSLKSFKDTSFKSLTNLTYLDLSHNKIDNSSNNLFSRMSKLKFIDLSFNELDAVSSSMLKGLHEITLIDLRNSAITMLLNYSFQDFYRLNTINASYNKITTIEYNSFYKTEALEAIDLSHNLLITFNINTSNILNIQELLLNDNKIENVSSQSLAKLTKLKVINFSQNNLLNINLDIFNNLIGLRTVILSKNKKIMSKDLALSDFNFKQVTNSSIENLDMSCNEITNINSLAIYFVKKLIDLKLHFNNIEVIDKSTFYELQSLRHLDLHNNIIKFIQPGSFLLTGSIEDLNLSNNHLSNLEHGTFNGLNNLRHLNLSNNILLSFTVSLFKNNAPFISTVAIDNNIISDIDIENFMRTNLKVLSLGGNPLPCPLLDTYIANNGQNFLITAEVKDYHSENIEGITCRYQHNKGTVYSKNETISLLTPLLHAIESNTFYTKQLVNINKHTSDLMEDAIKKLNETTKVNYENDAFKINQLLNTNQHIMSDLIKEVIRTLNETAKLTNYKPLEHNNLKDNPTEIIEIGRNKIVNNVTTQLTHSLKDYIISQNELGDGNNNNNKLDGLIYFILTCVILIMVFLISVSVYIYYKKRSHQDKSLRIGIHGLSNEMEI